MSRFRISNLGSLISHFSAGLLLACLLVITAACGGTTTLPAGVYTSQQYHFHVAYPASWQVNVSQQPDAAAPLIVVITRSGAHETTGSLISALTIDVLNLSDAGGTQAAAKLASDKSLTPVTISGVTAYRDHPITQQGAGNESTVAVTHTDYYLIQGAYEYQISIDALPSDQAALDTMAHSFTLS